MKAKLTRAQQSVQRLIDRFSYDEVGDHVDCVIIDAFLIGRQMRLRSQSAKSLQHLVLPAWVFLDEYRQKRAR